MLDNYSYGANVSDLYGTGTGGIDQGQTAADLSRGAWDSFPGAAAQPKKQEDIITKDASGHIAEVDKPDGTIYEYSQFQTNGQPSEIKIIDMKTGDYGQWKREDEGLWRSYDKEKPNYEVVRGEWVVDDKGMMHMQGRQDTTELPPKVQRDAEGHITRVSREDGVTYEYSKFDDKGQPTVAKITDNKTHDWGYWKKEGDHLWRSYDKEKPNYEVLKGDWTVDKNGTMKMDWVQDTKELPPQINHDAQGHITRVKNPDGTVYDYSKFDDCGQPTVCKITDKTGNWGYWKKEGDHLWRSYDKEKPNYEVLKGDWTVDDKGTMHMNGVQDTMALPHSKPASERPHVALSTGRKIGPGPDGVPTSAPEGYRNFRGHVSPEVVKEANSLLGGAFGTETPFEINGKKYMARVEPHYHPPGFKGGPNGWHKGVTVYEAKDQP
jgi:hypothetical protein